MSEPLPTTEEKIVEAKRLARLGFFRRAKDILAPLAETSDEACILLQKVEIKENRFEQDRRSMIPKMLRRQKRIRLLGKMILLLGGILYLSNMIISPSTLFQGEGKYICLPHICGILALLTGLGLISFRQALVVLDKLGFIDLPPDDLFDNDFLI